MQQKSISKIHLSSKMRNGPADSKEGLKFSLKQLFVFAKMASKNKVNSWMKMEPNKIKKIVKY